MKDKKLVIKIIIGIFLIIYFLLVILLCSFILKENKYGISESNKKSYIIINENNKTDRNKKGTLVVVEKKNINNIKVGDEVFTYKSDEKNKVYVSISKVESISLDTNPKYYVLEGDTGNYKSNSLIGTQIKTISSLGSIITFFTNKIVFLIFIIIPPIIFIMYEAYYILKYLDIGITKELEVEEKKEEKEIKELEEELNDNTDEN